jgi:hypothetical protein
MLSVFEFFNRTETELQRGHFGVEFPLTLKEDDANRRNVGIPEVSTHSCLVNPNPNNLPDKVIDSDYVSVPLYSIEDDRQEADRVHLLLAAGVDHNLLVYGGEAKSVVGFISDIMKQNGLNLTHILVDNEFDVDVDVELISVDGLKKGGQYNSYFTNQLGSSFPKGTENLIVGLCLDNKNFVNPVDVKTGKEGLAVLSNANIVLGAY